MKFFGRSVELAKCPPQRLGGWVVGHGRVGVGDGPFDSQCRPVRNVVRCGPLVIAQRLSQLDRGQRERISGMRCVRLDTQQWMRRCPTIEIVSGPRDAYEKFGRQGCGPLRVGERDDLRRGEHLTALGAPPHIVDLPALHATRECQIHRHHDAEILPVCVARVGGVNSVDRIFATQWAKIRNGCAENVQSGRRGLENVAETAMTSREVAVGLIARDKCGGRSSCRAGTPVKMTRRKVAMKRAIRFEEPL